MGGRFHGSLGQAQQLRGLWDGEIKEEAQHEHLTLLVGQSGERILDRQPPVDRLEVTQRSSVRPFVLIGEFADRVATLIAPMVTTEVYEYPAAVCLRRSPRTIPMPEGAQQSRLRHILGRGAITQQ